MHYEPTKLDISIGGYMGPSYRVQWKDGVLVYEAMERAYRVCEKTKVGPSEREWAAFWDGLDALRVWEWEDEYYEPVVDRTGRTVKIEHAGRTVHSTGSNAYPPKGDSPEPGELFERFCRAVSRLVGGRDFR